MNDLFDAMIRRFLDNVRKTPNRMMVFRSDPVTKKIRVEIHEEDGRMHWLLEAPDMANAMHAVYRSVKEWE